jgi:PAS domain S-box-containing protein
MENHADQRISRIRDLLKAQPRGLSISEIADHLGLRRHVVSKDLGYLHRMGQVEMQTIGTSKVYSFTAKVPVTGILDYFSDMILVVDANHTILEVNTPLLNLVKLRRDDLVGRRIDDLDASPLISSLKPDAFEEEGVEELNICLPGEDDPKAIHHFRARYVPMVFEDTSPGMVIFIENVTEHTRYRDAFLISEAHYKAIIENQTDLIFRFLPDGSITYTNWRFAYTFGTTESGLRGKGIFSFFTGDDASRFGEAVQALTPVEPQTRTVTRLDTVQGSRPFSVAVQAIHNDAGRLLGYHGIARDISAELEIEQERKSHVAHMEFLSRKSHDFLISQREEDLIWHLSTGLSELVPRAVNFVFTYDEKTREMEVRSIRDGKGTDLLDTVFPDRPVRFIVPSSVFCGEHAFEPVISGEISEISHERISSMAGDQACERIEAAIGRRRTYVTLMIREGTIIGAIALCLPPDEPLENRHLIETFIRMGALTLQQLITRNSLFLSDDRFRIIAETAPLPVSIISPDGHYLSINDKFIETFGYTLDDIPTGSMWFLKAFPNADTMKKARDLWISDLKGSSAGETRPRQFRVRCKDGSFKTITFRPVTLRDGCQLVLYEDISDQEEAEKDRNLLAEIVRSSHDAIIGMTTGGKIQTWNPGAERIYGFSAEEVIGQDIDVIFPASRLHEKDMLLAKVSQGEFISDFETERQRRDGKVIDVSVTISPIFDRDNQIIGTSTIVKDISAKKAEERLQRLESQYRDMVDSINVGVYRSTGDPEGRFLWGNTSLVRILGYHSLKSVRDLPVSDLFLRAHGREDLLKELKEGGFVRNREILLKRQDGSVAYVLVTALATFDQNGEIAYINGIVEDVTEQRVLARKLASLQRPDS